VGTQNKPGTRDAGNSGPELWSEGDSGVEEGDPQDGVAVGRHQEETGERHSGDGAGCLQERDYSVEVYR